MTSTINTARVQDDYAVARFNMVESQIRTNRVIDPSLLAILTKIPREKFVPESLVSVAYVDSSLRIAPDRYLIEPLVLGRLLQEATINPSDRVLIVGAGTGYSAAILADLAASVTALESDGGLAATARANLAALANVTVETGPLEAGWSRSGPYDVILIEGMVAELPTQIAGQLADYGRLATVQSQDGRCGVGMLYQKIAGSVSGRILFDASVPFLPGFTPRAAFAF